MEPFIKREKEYFYIKNWTEISPSIIAGFTTKLGGFSEGFDGTLNCGFHVGDNQETVRKNRQHLAAKLHFPTGKWVGCEQTHGIRIAEINSEQQGKGSLDYESSMQDTDGLYTRLPDTLLTLCYADCVPIYFFAANHDMIGIAHAGWKGTVKGIAKEMIAEWNKKGIEPSEIMVAIGPSICEKCYVVDNRVIKEVDTWLSSGDNKPYNEISSGQYQLNLRKLNQMILEKSGISSENIYITNLCTSCDHMEFYSHRRDRGNTGRMLGFIGLKGNDGSEG
ncbi:laccase [Heyndrickxia shackletonii]|uniref:Purine nucleoside phosphorylase n=1 Tax=Heyndrickxia shackletonii TaxID=157838 RepID=A0A0Q3WYA8_9BACI|nr:peptidoglycan editing factor PgeF [Heyndrickxia shackletonii]KQL54707.1 laccase [Heyndrickxia shackletonii]MBB2478749.1 peptidoglycan editing factor PgeF [Bacillus sp. APMAM]NEY98360.1 peptidoglycan editing factor PgeF [Heyndrickxia shackletonii]RTZ57885.1 peptidoglycan editing factor PgeF [Bacillus sp. SAJ1]